MEYQANIEKRISAFEDTLLYCEYNTRLLNAIQHTKENTRLYKEPLKACIEHKKTFEKPVLVSVSFKGTLETAKRLYLTYPDEHIGILNFASGSEPGGGVIRGSHTHEGYLCRCSTLYPCLNTADLQKSYYGYHKTSKNPLYTDTCIYTPGIAVLKTNEEWLVSRSESDWFFVDVISCSVPNLSEYFADSGHYTDHMHPLITEKRIRDLLKKRIKGILQAALQYNIHILVLGTFDWEVFFHSPYMAAEIYHDVLKEFTYSFREIQFTINCTPADSKIHEIFSSISLPDR